MYKIFYLFIKPLELLFLSFSGRKCTILTNFCDPEIPGLRRRQFRDSGLAKKARIWDPGIPIPSHEPSSAASCVLAKFRFASATYRYF